MRTTIVIVVASVVLASATLRAQDVDRNPRLTSIADRGKADAEYRLGAGDLIEVSVFGVESYRHQLRISAAGVVRLPLVDDPVNAVGLTPAELETRVAALLTKDLIKDPQVSVFVKEYRSQPVLVLGAVRNPGQYQITLQLKVVDVIAMAGGLQTNAVDEAVIQRTGADGQEQIIKVNLVELLEQGNLALNEVVRGGDVVHVQERQPKSVYVIGEVNRPGAFVLPVRRPLRVSQLFAEAGGASKTAKVSGGLLIRYDEKGGRTERRVNLDEILKGKKEDFFVEANDVIFVPGSKIKTFSQGLLTATVATIPYRVIP